MKLTASIFVNIHHPNYQMLDRYAFLCKNLKNAALYQYRQHFFLTSKTPSKNKIISEFTQHKQVDFYAIPQKVSQQIIFQIHDEFSSFWALCKKYQVDKTNKPHIPRYLHKEKGRANIILTDQAIAKKDLDQGILTLSSYFQEKLSFELGGLKEKINRKTLQQVRVIQCANGYEIKIVYQVANVEKKPKKQRYASIDLGVNNLLAMTSNMMNIQPVIISGKGLKSFNQYYNKMKATLKSQLDTCANFLKASIQRKLNRLEQKRKHKVNDYLHKASHYLINHAVSNELDTIVVGYNQGWKQGIDIGKVNNQKFVMIPYAKLLGMIQYKASLQGIEVIATEESYTSKCSFLEGEDLKKQDAYMGRRVKRGLFKAKSGKLMNADINASYNILRKVIGNFEFDPIQVCSTPKMINILNHSI